jgi:nucleoside diphosphate kinase
MQLTVYLIKPEGMNSRIQIHEMIEAGGDLIIKDCHIIKVPASILQELYPGIDREVWHATISHLKGNLCEIGLVRGYNAIAKLLAICGTETDPALCRKNTIRHIYGIHDPIKLTNGFLYHKNVIHRSKNHGEAIRDVMIYHNFLGSSTNNSEEHK